MPSLDIAISTKQNWANVQSILGRPGSAERLLWIESPAARQAQWSYWAGALLDSSGCAELGRLEDSGVSGDDPAAFRREAAQALEPYWDWDLHLHLVGGTKLMQAVLVDLLQNRATLHYSDRGRHHCKRPGCEWASGPTSLQLHFAALLYCYGFETRETETPSLRPEAFQASFREHQLVQTPGLGQEDLTRRWIAFRLTLKWALGECGTGAGLGDVLAWSRRNGSLAAFAAHRWEKQPELPEARLRSQWRSFQTVLEHLAHQDSATPTPPDAAPRKQSLGDAFEKRISALLETLAPRWGVLDQLASAKVFPIGSPFIRAELDHAWLLPGGVTWVFESKTGQADRKDLEARLRAYESCLGASVRTFLVFPEDSERADTLRCHAGALKITPLALPAQGDALEGLAAQLPRA